jgi:urea transport system permease protein
VYHSPDDYWRASRSPKKCTGEVAPANSIEVVVWTAVGGRGTIVGPIVGALLVNAGKSWFTAALPDMWLFALGGLFVATTLFLPKGIVGTFDQWRAKRWEAKAAKGEPPEQPAPSSEAEASIVRVAPKAPPAGHADGPQPQPAE